jgi:hypothetical protein
MGSSNRNGHPFWRYVRLGSLIMNRADAYYEPTDYDDRTDEIEERTWQLMKPGAKFDHTDATRVLEALSEISYADAELLQTAINTGNFELIGRKIMSISFEYMESIAKEIAETEINED